MKILRHLILLCLATTISLTAEAKNPKEKATEKTEEKSKTVYVFGVSQDLADSVVYFTAINPVEGAVIQEHNILKDRMYYTEQLNLYIADNLGGKRQTSAVFYDEKRKNLEKKLAKVQQQVTKKSPRPVKIQNIPAEYFHFKLPVIVAEEDANQ